jgi:SAM-dependent methyltransferase
MHEEFQNNVRLHALGLSVPRPLAIVDEPISWRSCRCHILTEHPAEVLSLDRWMKKGGLAEAQLQGLIRASAELLVQLAARGVWHRDARPANILLALQSGDRPSAAVMVDLRHMAYREGPWPQALEKMLAWATAFMLAGDADPRWARLLIEAAADADRRQGPGLVQASSEAIFARGVGLARKLVAREVRKGRRQTEALDQFARRYGSAADAENYRDRRFGRSGHGRKVDAAERRLVADLLSKLEVRGPVLDAPCGAGRFSPILASGGRWAISADVAEEMLRLARQTAAGAKLPCAFVAADARHLPLANRSVELAFSMRLLHRVQEGPERTTVLREMGRISRRWVLFSFYNCRTYRGLRDRLRGRYGGETRATIAAEVADAGLHLERFLPVGFMQRQTLVLCSVGT